MTTIKCTCPNGAFGDTAGCLLHDPKADLTIKLSTMTHYLHNNQLFKIDRMPPEYKGEFAYGDDCNCNRCVKYRINLAAFHTYLSTLHPIPHELKGEGIVVEGKDFEWRYEEMDINAESGYKVIGCFKDGKLQHGRDHEKGWAANYIKEGETYTIDHTEVGGWHTDVFLQEFPGISFNSVHFLSARRVAVPIEAKEQAIPVHIVDDMTLDSYYDGFKDGMNQPPAPQQTDEEAVLTAIRLSWVDDMEFPQDPQEFINAVKKRLRSQHPQQQAGREAVGLQRDIENGIKSRCRGLDDAYWMSDDDISGLAKDIIKELPTLYALFTSQHGEQEPNQEKLWEGVIHCILTNNKEGAKELCLQHYHITPKNKQS